MDASADSENGFTLVEVLISLVILSVVSIPLFSFFSRSAGFSGTIKQKSQQNAGILSADHRLRREISQIRFPMWVYPEIIVKSGGVEGPSVRIPYWKGDRDFFLEIRNENGFMSVTSPGISGVYVNWKIKDADIFHSCSTPAGLEIVVEHTEGSKTQYTLKCFFGSRGYGVFKEKTVE